LYNYLQSMPKKLRILNYLRFILAFICSGVQIASAAPEKGVQAKLLSSVQGTKGHQEILLGLQLTIPQGAKINAPSPENPAVAPVFEWQGSKNFKNAQVSWPQSKRYQIEGLDFYAYEKAVLIPIVYVPEKVNQSITAQAKFKYVLCQEQCVPQELSLTISLPSDRGEETVHSPLLTQAKQNSSVNPLPIEASVSFGLMVLFALLGGFILNFMPCVLPVLSLKFMSITRQEARLHKAFHYRSGLWATFAGILSSFILFGGAAMMLDSVGERIGWGLHFQQPVFLVFMIAILTLFTCNLFGLYEIALPGVVQTRLSAIFGHHFPHLVEDYLTGVFATLLATPCTAPFLGTALGYALSRSGGEIILLFSVMGMGFGLPYFIGALVPTRWLKLPKPGPWTMTLSRFLGGLLAITTIWLLWVLMGTHSLLATLVVAAAIISMIILFYVAQKRPEIRRWVWGPFFLILFTTFLPTTGDKAPASTSEVSKGLWQPLDIKKIPELVKAGKVVFIDVTADWCLTCKINKTLVLNEKKVLKTLSSSNVVAMRGDWTRYDADIKDFLDQYSRAGVPFNIVFGPKKTQGLVLSEILKKKDVLTALKRAQSD